MFQYLFCAWILSSSPN